uniref:ATP synthase F0 subunit 8 n=1 Tax=Ricania simulans TaxID=130630 RepID=UPI001EDFC9A5|nr:ATP synthase F0 subunit 8 [Ricania simulans]UJT96878.1 ATP synthase F0 subunit 8 [Ricania simulans]
MPQMSPMMWSMIMILTSTLMIQMSTNLYFDFKKKIKKNKKTNLNVKKSMTWKW